MCANCQQTNNCKDLRDAVSEAGGVAGTLWLSYVFVLFYLLLAIAGVSHDDQFLQNSVKLPFLQVIELPMRGFFAIGPVIVLLFHAYLLQHLTLLAFKTRQLELCLRGAPLEQNLLPINLFIQILAGPATNDATRWVGQIIAWVTLVVAPALTLLYFEVQFLPSHNEAMTWWARSCLAMDLGILWWMWPKAISRVAPTNWRGPQLWPYGCGFMAVLTAATLYLGILVATFPYEWLDRNFPHFPLYETLVGGTPDGDKRAIRTIWPNRLFVSGIDVVKTSKYDTLAKLAVALPTISMRGRHLEQAVMLEGQLARADFTGAHLQGASLVRAHAQGAWFDRADLSGAQLDGATLQGASFFSARMVGATMDETQLQGGRLAGANLRLAWMANARFDGASLASADLRRATLDGAWLVGANLKDILLQGASLAGAKLEGASLERPHLWKADFRKADVARALRQGEISFDADQPCTGSVADDCETTEQLRDMVKRNLPESEHRNLMLARLERSFAADKDEPWEVESKKLFTTFKQSMAEHERAELWAKIACIGNGAPFIVEMLTDTYGDDDGWTRPLTESGTEHLSNALLANTCTAKLASSPELEMAIRDLGLIRKEKTELVAGTQPH